MSPADALDDLAEAVVAGRAAPPDIDALGTRIAAEPALAGAWLAAVGRARLARRVLARPLRARRSAPAWRRWRLAAAALLAAAAAVALAVLMPAGSGPALRDAAGRAWSAGDRFALRSGERLELRWMDGCRIVLDGAAGGIGDGEPRLRLEQGRLSAEVEPRSGATRIATPSGTVAVIGTAFSVAVDPLAVAVAVQHGRVAWEPVQGARSELGAGEERLFPREFAGWTWEPDSDRPELSVGVDGGLEMSRPASGGIGYANISTAWQGPLRLPVRVDASSGRVDLNLLAVEQDADVWLVASRSLAGAPREEVLGMDDAGPLKLQVRQGDGAWDPGRVRRLIVSVWGGRARIAVPAGASYSGTSGQRDAM